MNSVSAQELPAAGRPSRDLLLRVFLPFACGYFLSYLYRSVNAVIGGDLSRELGLDAGDLGLLTAAYFFTFAAFQLPLGLLLDRFGPRRINAALLLVAGAGAALFALSSNTVGLTIARGMIGLGVSACLMSAMKAFVHWFPLNRLASLNGWMMATGGLGAMMASAPVEAMLEIVGWRGVFLVLSAASFVASATVFLVVPESRSGGEPETPRQMLTGLATVFSNARFWRVSLVCMTTQAGFLAVQGLWAGTWLTDVAGLTRAELGMQLLGFAIATTLGFAFFGSFSDRLAARGIAPLTIFKAGSIVAAAALAVIAFVPTRASIAAWLAFNFFSTSSPLGYSILSKEFPRTLSGRVNTGVNLLIFVAAFSIQWGLGAIINLWPKVDGHYPPAAYAAALGALMLSQVIAFFGVVTMRSLPVAEEKVS